MNERVTAAVIVEDEPIYYNHFGYAVIYQPSEGSQMSPIFCATEELADGYMKEYERNGTLTIHSPFENRDIVSMPTVMLKTKLTRALRIEHRQLELPNPNIIE